MATTQNVSSLKIHKLTQAQYDKAKTAGTLDDYALYLTPQANYAGSDSDGGPANSVKDTYTGSDRFNKITFNSAQYDDYVADWNDGFVNIAFWEDDTGTICKGGSEYLSVNHSNTSSHLFTARTLTIGNKGKTFDGSANVSWTLAEIGAFPVAGGTITGATSITNTTASSSTTTGALKVSGGIGCAGNIYGSKVYGAVWNDYAEFRISDCLEPGRVVCEYGDDTLTKSTKRLQPGASIISDTYGFSIGETDAAKCPVAVSGRVLAYGYEDRELFKNNIGHPVCAGPNGTVSIMTDDEYKNYGYCAIGIISAVPEYEEWGTGKVKVDGRIWIKVV